MVLLITTAGCSPGAASPAAVEAPEQEQLMEEGGAGAAVYSPGSYRASMMGMRGDVTVEVTVDETSILDVSVIEHEDTPGIAELAIETITREVVAEQSLAIDVVTGATITSYAVLGATERALTEAGADIAMLKAKIERPPLSEGGTEAADVVIVGSGAAGMAAAIEIGRNSDLNVIILEKLAYPGGSSVVNGGGIWAMGSAFNDMVGLDATADEYIAFMEERSGTTLNRELMRRIHGVSGETFDYLMDQGLQINTETLSLAHPDAKLPMAWAKINAEYPYNTGFGGKQLMDTIIGSALENGAELRVNSKVVSLMENNGEIIGVEVEGPDSRYHIEAKKVILATGGFTRNNQLVEELAPEYLGSIPYTGAGSHGDGILMTRELDTVIVGEGMMGLSGYNDNYGYFGPYGSLTRTPQMVVNQEGEQFGVEGLYYSEQLIAYNQQTGKVVYGISDATHSNIQGLEAGVEASVVKKADSLEALAEQLDVDGAKMIETAEANGLTTAPFYSINIRPLFIGSIPGLKITENTEVLNASGEVIPNLYAVGELVFGNTFSKWYPASGTGMGVSVYTGTIAGQEVVHNLQ